MAPVLATGVEVDRGEGVRYKADEKVPLDVLNDESQKAMKELLLIAEQEAAAVKRGSP